MKIVGYLISFVCGALIVIVPVAKKFPAFNRDSAILELLHTAQIVEKELQDISHKILMQLDDFGDVVGKDLDFSMKLLVENDRTAPEVYDMALRYMAPMGFTVLDIIDRGGMVVTSGHFPARSGNPAGDKLMDVTEAGTIIYENLKGHDVPTIQAKSAFKCSDLTLFTVGGIVIDSLFLQDLLPRKGLHLLLKLGSSVTGMPDIQTMSEIQDNSIIINDISWLAASIPLPLGENVPDKESVKLILLMPEPEKRSLFSLF